MEDQKFKFTATQIIADQILQEYKQDWHYFEHYSPKFDHEFFGDFGQKVETLVRLTPIQAIENVMMEKDEKIQIVIGHFHPLLYIAEAYLRCIPKVAGVPVTNFSLNALRDAVNRKCVLDIERSCRKIINEFEEHIDEFMDRNFLSIILNDFRVLTEKLKNEELEFVDFTNLEKNDDYSFEELVTRNLIQKNQHSMHPSWQFG